MYAILLRAVHRKNVFTMQANNEKKMIGKKVAKGFSLTELMIAIAILAVMVTVAVPGYTSIMASKRITIAANELASAFNFSLSKALAKNKAVTMEAVDGSFAAGWTVFSGTSIGNGEVFLEHPGFELNVHIEDLDIDDPLGTTVTFEPGVGSNNSSVKVLAICDRTGKTKSTKGVVITMFGQARVAELTETQKGDCIGTSSS